MTERLEHQRYLRQEEAKGDNSQTIFKGQGLAPNPNIRSTVQDTVIPLQKKVSCPFCLGLSQFRLFLVSTKKGLSRKVGKCPLCGQGLFLKSLVMMNKCTATEYANWVHPYARMGFWKKLNFQTWKRRLQLMGWTQEFWDRYHQLKGDPDERVESYVEYVERAQREEAQAQGLIT